jgi:ATP-binding cassette, subfamily B, bacterial
LRMAARADRIIYLENGCLAESGSHLALMLLEGRYAALYRLQTGSSDAVRGGHHHAVAG